MRVSDILPLKVRQVQGEEIYIVERKTKKTKSFAINPKLKKALRHYIQENSLNEYDYLFPSRKRNKKNGIQITHIQRGTAWSIINKAGKHVGLARIGTHSMRKTFGYHFYMKTHDVVTLQKLFNHATPTITLIYIGYQQDELNEAVVNFDY